MNKDKRGRPRKNTIRKMVRQLRRQNYSFTEVSKELGISRQLANYYDKELSTDKVLDKKL